MTDDVEDFFEFDMVVGADSVKCPYCGTTVSKSLLFPDDVECSGCGKKIKG